MDILHIAMQFEHCAIASKQASGETGLWGLVTHAINTAQTRRKEHLKMFCVDIVHIAMQFEQC